jgi:hypothetical protein
MIKDLLHTLILIQDQTTMIGRMLINYINQKKCEGH